MIIVIVWVKVPDGSTSFYAETDLKRIIIIIIMMSSNRGHTEHACRRRKDIDWSSKASEIGMHSINRNPVRLR